LKPLTLAAVLALSAAAPAGAAPQAPALHVLVVTDVGEGAQRTMPATLWRKLAVEYVGVRSVTAEDGTVLPDDAQCRSDHALYAVLATFERAMRLPGFPQDTSRAYGIARFTVRNCLTGTVSPTKTVRIESDPISDAERDRELSTERIWERAARTALAHDPLVLRIAVARIVRIVDGVVYLENGRGFAINQVLLVVDSGTNAHPPIQLVVLENSGKYAQASVIGNVTPHVGDLVEPASQ
jgi:hypothetical protein